MKAFGYSGSTFTYHTICRQNTMHEKWEASMINGFNIKIMVKSSAVEIVFKSLVPIRIYHLISTANSTLFV